MKIQCNVCEVAEAKVICCADEAAMCWACDHKIHTCNKLASKHQRVPLSSSSSQMPQCDVCQETVGYFFCLEDRALLCRKCDVAIHTANSLVSVHQRFLHTGVKVGLEATESGLSSSPRNVQNSRPEACSLPQVPAAKACMPVQASVPGDISASQLSFAGGSATGSIPQWHLDEYLELGNYHHNYNFMDDHTSKPNSGKLGASDCSPILRADGEFEGDEYMGEVPDTFWAVPQIPSPPTASGLHWPKSSRNELDVAAFVPDVSLSSLQNFHHHCSC